MFTQIRTLLAVFLIALPAHAQAATISLSSTPGTYTLDASTIASYAKGQLDDSISAILAPYTTVTFSFSLASTSPAYGTGVKGGVGTSRNTNYAFTLPNVMAYSGGTNVTNYAQGTTQTGGAWGGYNELADGEANYTKDVFYYLSQATLTDSKNASVTIENLSSASVLVWASLSSSIANLTGQTITYTISSQVAQTPLPAALPLFGFALAGLVLKRRKKS